MRALVVFESIFGNTKAIAEAVASALVSAGLGLREWLETLDCAGATIAAAFDTRVDKPRFPGAASHGAEKRLRRRGYTIAARGMSFFVEGVTGPLVAGEEDRARRWGESLAATVVGQRV